MTRSSFIRRRLATGLAALLVTAHAVAGLAVAGNSPQGDTAASWPSNGGWSAYQLSGGAAVMDVRGDASPAYTDVSSGPTDGSVPSVYTSWDGTTVFFRLRLAADPSSSQGGFDSAQWVVQVAVGGTVRAIAGVDGKSSRSDSVFVATGSGSNLTSVYEHPFTGESAGVRSKSDGQGGYFLDWQVPLARLSAASNGAITSGTSLKLFFGTSAANNVSVINKDYMTGSSVSFDDLESVVLPEDTEPTSDPTTEPTTEPTADPTTEPTSDPTSEATSDPTTEPTTEPTADPTTEPTTDPTTEPTSDPEPEIVEDPDPSDSPDQNQSPDPIESPDPSDSPDPLESPDPIESPDPTTEPTTDPTTEPTSDPEPEIVEDPDPSDSPDQNQSPDPSVTPAPTSSPAPQDAQPSATPGQNDHPRESAERSNEPEPTGTPEPADEPVPTPAATSEPVPGNATGPEQSGEPSEQEPTVASGAQPGQPPAQPGQPQSEPAQPAQSGQQPAQPVGGSADGNFLPWTSLFIGLLLGLLLLLLAWRRRRRKEEEEEHVVEPAYA